MGFQFGGFKSVHVSEILYETCKKQSRIIAGMDVVKQRRPTLNAVITDPFRLVMVYSRLKLLHMRAVWRFTVSISKIESDIVEPPYMSSIRQWRRL